MKKFKIIDLNINGLTFYYPLELRNGSYHYLLTNGGGDNLRCTDFQKCMEFLMEYGNVTEEEISIPWRMRLIKFICKL